jgi:hypothetical protein
MEAEAGRLFDPITDALNGNLDSTALVELHMPINVLQRLPNSEVRSIHKALIDWVKVTAPTIPKRPYPDYRGNAVGPIDVKGVPFPVTLVRFEPALIPGRHFDIRHTAVGIYQARTERMKRAIEKKFPKLAAWKRDHGAMACTRFRRHRVRCFYGTGGASWNDEDLPGNSSLRLCA